MQIKMQVTPSSTILPRLSVCDAIRRAFDRERLPRPPSLAYSSLRLNYWWPRLQPPEPSSLPRLAELTAALSAVHYSAQLLQSLHMKHPRGLEKNFICWGAGFTKMILLVLLLAPLARNRCSKGTEM